MTQAPKQNDTEILYQEAGINYGALNIGKPDKIPAGGAGTTGPSGYKRGDTPGQGVDT